MSQDRPGLVTALGRNPVLVGLPGAGKSSVGKRLATRLGVPFVDADTEIEKAAGMTIDEIFKMHGEPAFRDGEARVIARLVQAGPHVIATGGGAFMRADTRAAIAEGGIAVWLDAPTDVLIARIMRRDNRPLFHNVDPRQKLLDLRAIRDPHFAEAPVKVLSSAGPHDRVVNAIVRELQRWADRQNGAPSSSGGEPGSDAAPLPEPAVNS
ncbi:shikimate kinase [Acuticoccus yangtzensis]|uniref:shikimate kinase n=1 Tax=Acuticoccus yangtzensis TaxID=1443441 RepID=UPI000AFF90B0|nr:shikimate kinase [Acuticoccus yangtzensis]